MKIKKFLVVLVAIVILMSMLAGCSRNGNGNANATHLGPSKTHTDTVSAILTNKDYPNGITLNWSNRNGNSAATFTGLQQISFILDGDEIMEGFFGSERPLSSFTLEFTSQTSGKKVTLSSGLTGKISNIGADSNYFRMDGNTIQFYPHYFNVGEDVTVKATFTYKKEGLVNQIMDSKSAEGYFTFTVGEDTGETFSNAWNKIEDFFDDIGDTLSGNGNNGNNTNDGNSNNPDSNTNETVNFIQVRFKATGNVEGTVYQYEDDSVANPIVLGEDKIAQVIFYTRENSNYDICKMYVVPLGMENQVEKMSANNKDTYAADNCHKFKIDMNQFSGQTVTLRVEFLDGSEWNPMPDHYYGFITFQVP